MKLPTQITYTFLQNEWEGNEKNKTLTEMAIYILRVISYPVTAAKLPTKVLRGSVSRKLTIIREEDMRN